MDLSGLIDADTHVDETDATWEYMGLDDQRKRDNVETYQKLVAELLGLDPGDVREPILEPSESDRHVAASLREASDICNVPTARIEEFAELYAGNKPSLIHIGVGLQRNSNGGEMVAALVRRLASKVYERARGEGG